MTYQKQWSAGDQVAAADLNNNFTPLYMFGGDGADGGLSIAAGTTTINVGAVQILIKNYTSISITGTGVLNFSNPHANGTIIKLLSQGNATITSSANPAIDVSNMGSSAGEPATSLGSGAKPPIAVGHYDYSAAQNIPEFIAGIGSGNPTTTLGRFISISCGAGGGGGGTGSGGRGGGALYIECNALNITAIIWAKGQDGTTGTLTIAGTYKYTSGGGGGGFSSGDVGQVASGAGSNSWGGGGGGGGSILIVYKTLTANTGTFTVTGGNGGTGTQANGGNGGNGKSTVEQDKYLS